ncbi:12496_t:CDS:2 [Ambispora gerdemannii]|uniref:12496_t:CDS:1 n=1 Tax=Ambispora gerdemannii TaxID=144530 RepID=A0A9N8UXX7_9GLOM|nr:12496_t:CDS:2 [Ambispora gerdemannii]
MSKPASTTTPAQQPTQESGEPERPEVKVTNKEYEYAERMITTIEDEFDDYNEEEDEDYQELIEEDESDDESDDGSEEIQIDPEEVQDLIRTAVAPLPELVKEQLLDPTATMLRDGKKVTSPMKNQQGIDQITEQFRVMLT